MKQLKPWIAIAFSIVLFLSGCGDEKEKTGNGALDGKLEIGENQTLYVGQISEIKGNQITLTLAEEMDMSSMKGQRPNNDTISSEQNSVSQSAIEKEANKNQMQPNENSRDDGFEGPGGNGEMPGGPPSNDQNGEMPREQSQNSKEREGNNSDNQNTEKKESSDKKQSMTAYQLTGDEKTMLIPVGTPVTTLLGTTATFSRISAESMVKIVTEKDVDGNEVIVSVWIVG